LNVSAGEILHGSIAHQDLLLCNFRMKFQHKTHERKEVTRSQKKQHNEQLHHLHSSPNSIKMIKSRKIKYSGHEVRMGEMTNSCKILVETPEGT
jgi:hypothetical protein